MLHLLDALNTGAGAVLAESKDQGANNAKNRKNKKKNNRELSEVSSVKINPKINDDNTDKENKENQNVANSNSHKTPPNKEKMPSPAACLTKSEEKELRSKLPPSSFLSSKSEYIRESSFGTQTQIDHDPATIDDSIALQLLVDAVDKQLMNPAKTMSKPLKNPTTNNLDSKSLPKKSSATEKAVNSKSATTATVNNYNSNSKSAEKKVENSSAKDGGKSGGKVEVNSSTKTSAPSPTTGTCTSRTVSELPNASNTKKSSKQDDEKPAVTKKVEKQLENNKKRKEKQQVLVESKNKFESNQKVDLFTRETVESEKSDKKEKSVESSSVDTCSSSTSSENAISDETDENNTDERLPPQPKQNFFSAFVTRKVNHFKSRLDPKRRVKKFDEDPNAFFLELLTKVKRNREVWGANDRNDSKQRSTVCLRAYTLRALLVYFLFMVFLLMSCCGQLSIWAIEPKPETQGFYWKPL